MEHLGKPYCPKKWPPNLSYAKFTSHPASFEFKSMALPKKEFVGKTPFLLVNSMGISLSPWT